MIALTPATWEKEISHGYTPMITDTEKMSWMSSVCIGVHLWLKSLVPAAGRAASPRATGRGRLLLSPLFCITFFAGLSPASADDAPAATAPPIGFRSLLDKHQREALRQIADYVARNPDADDAEQASLWMFETASAQGLEAEVVGVAEQFLKRRELDQPAISKAREALCLGLARTGKLADAVGVFDASLKGIRFQNPFRTLDLASSLSAQARIAGDLAASREIYERVAGAFPLNAQMGEI